MVGGGGGQSKKTEILSGSVVCRGDFLTQLSRHGRIECDGCQKGDNSTRKMNVSGRRDPSETLFLNEDVSGATQSLAWKGLTE